MNQTAISEERAFAELAQHLRDRRDELEQSILTRAQAIADPADTGDPEYASGFRAATFAALDYGLAAIERPAEGVPPVPPALLVQARLAARCGVSLDIVLRRYFAGFALMGDFVLQAAKQVSGLEDASLEHLLRDQAASFDRLIVAVSEEHSQERERRLRSPERRRVDRIKSLLDGESADSSELGYQLDCHHLAIVARGEGAAAALRELATPLGSRLLLARPDPRTAWSWLGS
ncbi:MAG TPA: hypothetical protein VN733_06755, partial [Solirubrobacterales bacterium]|nr:hypothetical protein [Solirubrobacterales bacterium]